MNTTSGATATALLASAALAGGSTPSLAGPAEAAPAAGELTPEECTAGPHRRAFDFWVGRWTVRSEEGEALGRSHVRRVSGGCALLESWTSENGTTGTSLNFYDPEAGHWVQVWVGGNGLRLRLEGGVRGNAMVLEGTRTRDCEQLRDRITWTPSEEGTVRQTWEISTDGGRTWSTSWEGIYRPVGPEPGTPPG